MSNTERQRQKHFFLKTRKEWYQNDKLTEVYTKACRTGPISRRVISSEQMFGGSLIVLCSEGLDLAHKLHI